MRYYLLTIYLWFLVTAAAAGAVFALAAFSTPEATFWGKRAVVISDSMSLHAVELAETYERSGSTALAADLNRLRTMLSVEATLYDGTGIPFFPTAGDAPHAALARDAARTQEKIVSHFAAHIECAHPVVSQSGKRYVLVVSTRGAPYAHLYTPLSRGLLALGLVGIFCYGAASALAAPVERLRRATHRIAHGDLSARVGATMGHRRDELAALGRDFDQMAARLEAVLQAQRRLVGDVSHELRSPLSRLRVALELARRKGEGTDRVLDRMEHEIDRLSELIDQLLLLARMEGDMAGNATTLVDVSALLQQVVSDADFEACAEGKGVELTRCDPCRIDGNAELLRRAFENVVRNGVRYTSAETVVTVTLQMHQVAGEDTILVTVRDYGTGVPEDELTAIFRPFYRTAEARDRQSGGVGLGLAIAEQAVHLHRGTLRATNSDPGLCLEICLPVREATATHHYLHQ